MIKSTELNELFAALSAAQIEFQDVIKDKTANIPTKSGKSYSYSYADLATTISATKPALTKHGLTVTQLTSGGNDEVTVTTLLGHKSGQYLGDEWRIPARGLTMQELGSMITYARRYSLTSLLGVAADTDDDDGKSATERQHDQRAASNRARQMGDKAAAQATGSNGNGDREYDLRPVSMANRTLVSQINDRVQKVIDTVKATDKLNSASEDIKAQWSTDLKALTQDINVQLTLRGLDKLRAASNAWDAYNLVKTGVSILIDNDQNAPIANETEPEVQS